MNCRRLLRSLLPVALLVHALSAVAGTATTLQMSATVLSKNNCRFSTITPATLAFAAITPTSPTNATVSVTWAFRCTGSDPIVSYLITAGNGEWFSGGSRQMRHAVDTARFLPYSISISPSSGTFTKGPGQSAPVNFTITGTILPADFRAALAGAYSDTVTVALTP